MNKYAIIGYGGFAREVLDMLPSNSQKEFYVSDEWFDKTEKLFDWHVVKPLSLLKNNHTDVKIVVAIGDPKIRMDIVEELKSDCPSTIGKTPSIYFPNIVTAKYGYNFILGYGNIICDGTIITTNVKMGNFNIINLNCTIGHDCILNNYITLSPACNVSGNVEILDGVYIGTNACIREKLFISEDTVLGMGSVLVKSITTPNYIVLGNPAKLHTVR